MERKIGLVALLAVALGGCGSSGNAQSDRGAEPPAAAAPPAAASASDSAQSELLAARSKGSPDAPVTVYEMSDFQCPFCARHAAQTFPAIEREYIEPGKVRWVFINFPLTQVHANALPAAELAHCATAQDKFWPVHDLLFKYQETWAPMKEPGPFLLSLADSAGLASDSVLACLKDPATRAAVRADAEGAQRAGATSTPTFYIEGGLLTGAHSIQVFREVLDSIYGVKAEGR